MDRFNHLGGFPDGDAWNEPPQPDPVILGSPPTTDWRQAAMPVMRGPNSGATLHDHTTGSTYRIPDSMTVEETQDILAVLEPQMQTQRLVKLASDLVMLLAQLGDLESNRTERARSDLYDSLYLVSARLLKSLEREGQDERPS